MLNINHYTFQELKPDQLYAILSLRIDVFCLEQNCLYQELDNKDQCATHFVGTENNQLAVYGRVLFDEEKQAYSIGRVVTAEAYRNQGLARVMMQRMIHHIETHYPEEKIVLSAQVYIREFYASLGFKIVGEEYLEDGLPHIKMIKEPSLITE